MSDALGPIAYEGNSKSMFGEEGIRSHEYSNDIERKIDEEVSAIMKGALKRAEETLHQYKEVLVAVAEKLLDVETLEQDDYNQLIKQFGLIGKVESL